MKTLSLTNLSRITKLDFSKTSDVDSVGGRISLTKLDNIVEFKARKNGIIKLTCSDVNTKLFEIDVTDNAITDMPNIAALPVLNTFRATRNQIAATIPTSLAPSIQRFNIENNNFTGQITDISGNTNLIAFVIGQNAITGNFPDLSAHTKLEHLRVNKCNLTGAVNTNINNLRKLKTFVINHNSFTGNLPWLGNARIMVTLHVHNNNLVGSLPNFSNMDAHFDPANNGLKSVNCSNNNFTSYGGTSIPATHLTVFNVHKNALSESAINNILSHLVASGKTFTQQEVDDDEGGVLKLEGGTNSPPTGQGLTDVSTLRAGNWTVTHN